MTTVGFYSIDVLDGIISLCWTKIVMWNRKCQHFDQLHFVFYHVCSLLSSLHLCSARDLFVSLKTENTQFPSEHDCNAETKSFRFKDRNRGIFVPFCLRLLLNTLLELILLNVTSNHNTQQRLYDIVKQYLRTAPFLLPVCVCVF